MKDIWKKGIKFIFALSEVNDVEQIEIEIKVK